MPDIELTSAELDELERLAKAATPGDLDTVNDPANEYGGKSVADYYDCPCCQGSGAVDGVTYTNFDGVAMGVQFFGIGNEHKNYEAFFRAANPATILPLISLARSGLEARKAEESMRERAADRAAQAARECTAMKKVDGLDRAIAGAMIDVASRIEAAIRALPLTTEGGDKP